MLYAGACAAGWLVLFVLLDAFLLLTVPGSPVRLADSELCACLWVLCAAAVLTCAPALTNGGAANGADWSFHLSRIEGIANGLREGQFPVRVYSMAKDGYGYAPSLFYGELLLYFPAVLRLLGMSVQGACQGAEGVVQDQHGACGCRILEVETCQFLQQILIGGLPGLQIAIRGRWVTLQGQELACQFNLAHANLIAMGWIRWRYSTCPLRFHQFSRPRKGAVGAR